MFLQDREIIVCDKHNTKKSFMVKQDNSGKLVQCAGCLLEDSKEALLIFKYQKLLV